MRKEFEINGCIEVSPEVTEDKFWEKFIQLRGVQRLELRRLELTEIQDGYYLLRTEAVVPPYWTIKITLQI